MRTSHTALGRKSIAIVGATFAMSVLAACGGGSDAPTSEATSAAPTVAASPTAVTPASLVPADIAESGTLTVGMEFGYPPYEYMDEDNTTVIGFDVDLANELANRLGLEPEIIDSPFDSIIPSLLAGRLDVGISAFSVTEERLGQVDMITYFQAGDGLLVPGGNPDGLALDESICGLTVVVQKASSQELVTLPQINEKCAAAGKPDVDAISLGQSEEVPLAVQSGRAKAALMGMTGGAFLAENSEGKFELVGPFLNSGPVGMATAKGNGLAEAISAGLQSMIDDGTYAEILTRWGVEGGAVTTAAINDAPPAS